MVKTIRDLIKELDSIKDELKDMPVLCYALNGLQVPASIKFRKTRIGLELTKDTVDALLITED